MKFDEKSLAQNYIFNLARTLCNVAFPVITFAYTSRILGTDGIGSINFTKSIVSYFIMIAVLGINQYGTREAAKLRDDRQKLSKFVHEVLCINLITTVLAYVLLIISIFLIPKLHDYYILLCINSIAIFMQGMGMEWLYQAVEDYEYIAKRAIIFQFIAFGLVLLLVHDSNDLVIYAVINVISSSGSYIFNFINAKKYIDWNKREKCTLRKHLPGMLWLFAMTVSVELYTVLDSTMLGFLCNDSSVGLYTAAIKVNKLVIALISSLGTILIPRLSYYVGEGEKIKLQRLINKGYNFIFMLSIPAALGLFSLSDNIIHLFSGMEYMQASITMKIMTVIVIVIPFSMMTNNQIFVPMGKEKLILVSTCVGAFVNFLCNWLFIPRYAENGAAIGTVVAELAVALVCLYNSIRLLDMKKVFRVYYQYWIAAITILPISWIIKRMTLNYILEIVLIVIVSGLAYVSVLFLLKNEYIFFILDMILVKVKKHKISRNK